MDKPAQRIPEVVDVSTQPVFTTNVRDFQCQVSEQHSTPGNIFDVTKGHNYGKKSIMSTPLKLKSLKLSVRDPIFYSTTMIVKMLIMTHPLRNWARVKLGLDKKNLCVMFLLWAIWKCRNLLYFKVCWIYCFGKLNVKDVDCNLYPYSGKWPSYHWVESATSVWSTSSF